MATLHDAISFDHTDAALAFLYAVLREGRDVVNAATGQRATLVAGDDAGNAVKYQAAALLLSDDGTPCHYYGSPVVAADGDYVVEIHEGTDDGDGGLSAQMDDPLIGQGDLNVRNSAAAASPSAPPPAGKVFVFGYVYGTDCNPASHGKLQYRLVDPPGGGGGFSAGWEEAEADDSGYVEVAVFQGAEFMFRNGSGAEVSLVTPPASTVPIPLPELQSDETP